MLFHFNRCSPNYIREYMCLIALLLLLQCSPKYIFTYVPIYFYFPYYYGCCCNSYYFESLMRDLQVNKENVKSMSFSSEFSKSLMAKHHSSKMIALYQIWGSFPSILSLCQRADKATQLGFISLPSVSETHRDIFIRLTTADTQILEIMGISLPFGKGI